MKKTVKRPDGTEEVVEGTAEEIAEYERKLNETTKKKETPGLIKGADVDGIPLTDKEVEWVRILRAMPLFQPLPSPPIWITLRSICHRVDCNGNHWYEPYITWGTSSDTTRLLKG